MRPNDAGMITLGDPLTLFPDIPSGAQNAHFETSCPSACTARFSHEIHVFNSFLHMHELGKEIWSTRWSGEGNEPEDFLGLTNSADYWSFAFQQGTSVSFTIQPGQRLNTHCVYDTSKLGSDTNFGVGSDDEMCMEFLM